MTGLTWQKSSFSGSSGGGECVELTSTPDGTILCRESDTPGVALTTTPTAWAALLQAVRSSRTLPTHR